MDERTRRKRSRAILRMNSGRLSNRSFPRASSAAAAHHERPRGGQRDLLPCCERDAPGDSCPTTFHRRGQSTITFERGPVTGLFQRFTTPFVNGFALQRPKRRAERGVHRQSIGEDERTRGIDGYDAAQKDHGRKRHILVDTMGLILAVVVLRRVSRIGTGRRPFSRRSGTTSRGCKLGLGDGGYAGKLVEWVRSECGWVLEIVKRTDDVQGFQTPAPPLGRRANLRLVGTISPNEQGL